ncbi:MAG: oligopeptide ABC transporter ATP-binding protein OppF [Thiothrix sp.]|nr:MAG: oligopeptide ABC transporter ATP-binding protein OppF [Thiothrix sp.]
MLQIDNISVSFDTGKSQRVDALKGVSFDLAEKQTLGIVGESGSGKSTIARAITQLVPLQQGRIDWFGQNTNTFNAGALREFRRQVQLIFQDPLDALDPRMIVAEIVAEPLHYLRTDLAHREIDQRVKDILPATGLSTDYLHRYPHEFSGGQCQRIGIARAMIAQPRLLICDEPVSALDVSIQAQIINLLVELRQTEGLSMIFISHDMSVVRHISERVLVLYAGCIMELADVETLYKNSQHPYTKSLLEAMPLADPRQERQRLKNRSLRAGNKSLDLMSTDGCAYFSRCPEADQQCEQQPPELRAVADNHLVACHKR